MAFSASTFVYKQLQAGTPYNRDSEIHMGAPVISLPCSTPRVIVDQILIPLQDPNCHTVLL